MVDNVEIRSHFPILHQKVNGRPLIYFDNAATTQKPKSVIEALYHYYSFDNANIHRGIHTLAERATLAYENTRELLKQFINANEKEEVVFTRGTTEGINLIANTFGKTLKKDDIILISEMEHHSNIVPWQMLAQERGIVLKAVPILPTGELNWEKLENLLNERVKLVSIMMVSNALGTINPTSKIIQRAKAIGAKTLVDAAQAASHLPLDVQSLDCDFLVFSAHKMYGPTGVGVMYGKRSILESIPPYQGGGEMIRNVSISGTTYNDIPYKFEAGTPNIADTIAFSKAIDFVNTIGKDTIAKHESALLNHAEKKMGQITAVKPIGTAKHKIGVYSFEIDQIHPFDIGQFLDSKGIAIRTGHHCAQPLMESLGIEGTCRASFAVYNTLEEIDAFVEAIQQIIKKWR